MITRLSPMKLKKDQTFLQNKYPVKVIDSQFTDLLISSKEN